MEPPAATDASCDRLKDKLKLYKEQKKENKAVRRSSGVPTMNRNALNRVGKENKAPSNKQVLQKRSSTASYTSRCISKPTDDKRTSFVKSVKPTVQSTAVTTQLNDAPCMDTAKVSAVESRKRTSFSECDDVRVLMDCDDKDNLAVGELAHPTSLRFSFGDRDQQDFCSDIQDEQESSSSLNPIEKTNGFQQVKDEVLIMCTLI
jgi:hypothetical protein